MLEYVHSTKFAPLDRIALLSIEAVNTILPVPEESPLSHVLLFISVIYFGSSQSSCLYQPHFNQVITPESHVLSISWYDKRIACFLPAIGVPSLTFALQRASTSTGVKVESVQTGRFLKIVDSRNFSSIPTGG
jgi:hypothetical protein